MSYIAPDSTIHILHNVPLHKSYENTAYFENATLQRNYFLTKLKRTYNDYTYLRKERVLRVEGLCDYFYDCNYLMFQNTAFGNKWFYAFIDDVRYINNNTTEIVFTLDVMQTWFFDYTMEECYVEREHTTSDEKYEHLEAENFNEVEVIPSVNYGADKIFPSTSSRNIVVLAVGLDSEGELNKTIEIHRGVADGCSLLPFDIYNENSNVREEQLELFRDYIATLDELGRTDSIVGLFQMPSNVFSTSKNPLNLVKSYVHAGNDINMLNGYIPKNNKLFNYPFNYLRLRTKNYTEDSKLKFELFRDRSNVEFYIEGSGGLYPTVRVSPINYLDNNFPVYLGGEETTISTGCSVSQTYGTTCSYSTDYYRAWLATQEGATNDAKTSMHTWGYWMELATNAGNAVATGGTSVTHAGGALIAGIENRSIAIYNLKANALRNQFRTGEVKNVNNNSQFTSALEDDSFICEVMQILPHQAKMIDSYFTMYGYTCAKVKVPNRNARPFFTYTKTVGCQIHGSIPQDDTTMIESIFDNGVRFWNNPELIGQYSELDNKPDID